MIRYHLPGMDSDSLLRETKTALEGGLDFLRRIPGPLPEDVTKIKVVTEDAFQNLLEKWNKVKSIVPEFLDETPKGKPKTTLQSYLSDWPLTKVRSGSMGDLDVSTPSETHYANLITGFHTSAAVTKTRKKSIQNFFKLTPSSSNVYSTIRDDNIPKSGDTLIGMSSGPSRFNPMNFTMASDGSFSLVADQVRLQIGTDKTEKKNLYCALRDSYLLFGPLLTNVPPIAVINLETCIFGYSHKKNIQLIEGDTKYLIKFSPDTDIAVWLEKIKGMPLYTCIRESMLVDVSPPVYQPVDELDVSLPVYQPVDGPVPQSNYSYVRQERYLGPNKGEYSYIHSVNCHDCHGSIERKTSTAEAIIDRSYVNTSSMHSVKSLVSHFQEKGKI